MARGKDKQNTPSRVREDCGEKRDRAGNSRTEEC